MENKYLKSIIEDDIKEEGYIYTPLNLCHDMINTITIIAGNILVIRNIEFILVLRDKGININNVHYSTNCQMKKQIALHLGISLNNIHNLEYNTKDINLGTKDMKFDIVIQNPPYNPNSLWKKFVEKGIELLKDDGKMLAIHPTIWRESSNHDKLKNILINNISELHIMDYEAFKEKKVGVKTDWYLYDKTFNGEATVYYPSDVLKINLKDIKRILRISPNSLEHSILDKLCTKEDNGIIMDGITGYHSLYKKHDPINGKYKQCGSEGRGTTWTTGDYSLTIEPNKNQFLDKVVIAYSGKPRSKFFSKEDEIGVVRANYWLTDNKSLPILLNSKMFYKLISKIVDPDKGMFKPYGTMPGIPPWYLKSINFDNLNVQNEEELYKHYKLTKEEIEWIEN